MISNLITREKKNCAHNVTVIVDVNVKRFWIKEMLLRLRVEREVFARKSVKRKRVTGRNFLRFNLDFSNFGICEKFEVWNWSFGGDSSGNLILDRLKGDSEVGLETRWVLDPLRLDLENFAALCREKDRFLTFQADRAVAFSDDNFLHRTSIFVGQNEDGRPNRVDLEILNNKLRILFMKISWIYLMITAIPFNALPSIRFRE